MSEYTREEILKLIEEKGGPEGLDLSGKDLSGIDLSSEVIAAELDKAPERAPGETPVWYSELTGGIDLRGANLRGAKLWVANLHGADLVGAKLQEVFLVNADLQEANLRGADLEGADLTSAKLQGAGLSAKLQGAKLRGANLQRAILRDADLQEANLAGADLEHADLTSAKLQRAKLMHVNLQWAGLGQADLQRADLTSAKLQGAYLMSANLQWADLEGADLQGADLMSANLEGAHLWRINLQGAKLAYSHLEKVDFFGAGSLQGAYFYGAFFDDTRMKREQLGEAIGEELEGKYDEAKEAYLDLKNNFAEIGRYEDAAWAYCKERRMEKLAALKEAKEAWQKRDWKGAIPRFAKVGGDQSVECLCDYGEGFWRVVGWLIAVWVIFALIYGLTAGVWGPWQDTECGKIRYITRNAIDLLSFSLGAMTTLEPTGLEAIPILAMRILMPLEALLGIFLAGLVGFVAGNRIRRR